MKQQIEDEFIYGLVETYLEKTNLSLRQVANKWEISPSLLSLIKNRKRRPNIDIALKIMQANRVSANEQAKYCELRTHERSKQYEKVKDEIKKAKESKLLTENFSKILETEPYALDIFLEVSLAGEKGKSHPFIFKEYGSLGIQIADYLALSEFIHKKDNRYYINESDCNFKPTRRTLFGIINKINQRFNQRVHNNDFQGSFHLEINEVSEEGYQQIKQVQKKYINEIQQIIADHHQPLESGGIRMSFNTVMGKIKEFVTLCLVIFLFIQSSSTLAGGVSGGYDDSELKRKIPRFHEITPTSSILNIRNINLVERRIQERNEVIPRPILKFERKNENFEKQEWQLSWQTIQIEFPSTPQGQVRGFSKKPTALKALEIFVTNMKQHQYDEKTLEVIQKQCLNANSDFNQKQKKDKQKIVSEILHEGLIRNGGMQIESYITNDFEEKFVPKLFLKVPCRML